MVFPTGKIHQLVKEMLSNFGVHSTEGIVHQVDVCIFIHSPKLCEKYVAIITVLPFISRFNLISCFFM